MDRDQWKQLALALHKRLLEVRECFVHSYDPVIAYRTGKFEEREEAIHNFTIKMNELLQDVWPSINNMKHLIKEDE